MFPGRRIRGRIQVEIPYGIPTRIPGSISVETPREESAIGISEETPGGFRILGGIPSNAKRNSSLNKISGWSPFWEVYGGNSGRIVAITSEEIPAGILWEISALRLFPKNVVKHLSKTDANFAIFSWNKIQNCLTLVGGESLTVLKWNVFSSSIP